MAKPVKIGNRFFGSFREADKHFKSILDRVDFNQPIFDPTDHKDLSALLLRYNDVLVSHGVASKLPDRICYFKKCWNRSVGWTTPGFSVVCINAFETDFSYLKAVRTKVDPPDVNFYKACRQAVSEDLLKAKKNAFERHSNSDGEVKCEVSGQWSSFKGTHLDHAGPFFFNVLVSMFRETKGWVNQFPEDLLTQPGPGDYVVKFVDTHLRDSFRSLHKRHAVLRLVSAKENLARASFARRPAIQRPVVIR